MSRGIFVVSSVCFKGFSEWVKQCTQSPSGRVGVNSIISTPTPTPEVSTPTPTPANLQNINSNSNSGGFNSNSNSNCGKSPEYQLQLQLQLRRFQLQLQFQLRRFQLQFQLQLQSFKSNPNSISNPINLVQLNYHYQITMWNIVWIKWRYAVDAMLSQILIKQVNIGIADDKIFPWFS